MRVWNWTHQTGLAGSGLPAARTDAVVREAVRIAQSGDPGALAYLYARFAANVRRRAAAVLGDDHLAEDVTQEVFSRLGRTIRQYEDRGTPFEAWLMRVARNAALDEVRRSHPTPVEELPVPETLDLSAESDEAFKDALSRLPADQREVLVLRHVVGLRPAEVAARLGRSREAVNCLHYRAALTLRAFLDHGDPLPRVSSSTRPAVTREGRARG